MKSIGTNFCSSPNVKFQRFSSCGKSKPHTNAKRMSPKCYASGDTYYDILGISIDSDQETIKAAFRRKAKELHPDVNKDEDAEEVFIQCNTAYETLIDEDKRAQYDHTHRLRRMNFFRDVEESSGVNGNDDDDVGSGFAGGRSPFRWSHLQHEEAEEEEDAEEDADPYEDLRRMQELFANIGLQRPPGMGGLANPFGRPLDPWGASTSDSWYQQARKQQQDPFNRNMRHPAEEGFREWGPGQLGDEDQEGYKRGSEWNHPRRLWDEMDNKEQKRNPQQGNRDPRGPFRI